MKNHSGLKLRLDEEYAHSYIEVAVQLNVQHTPLPGPEVIAPELIKPEIVKPEVVKTKPKPIPKIIEPAQSPLTVLSMPVMAVQLAQVLKSAIPKKESQFGGE